MRLYLVRHGEAVSPVIHKDRPLSDVGRKQVQGLGKFLERLALKIDMIYHSGILRAQETAEILGTYLSDRKPEVMQGLHPNDPVEEIAEQAVLWAKSVMVVGHLPFMELLVSHLTTRHAKQTVMEFETSSIVCLDYHGDKHWVVCWALSPEVFMPFDGQ